MSDKVSSEKVEGHSDTKNSYEYGEHPDDKNTPNQSSYESTDVRPEKPGRNPRKIIVPVVLILGIGGFLGWYLLLRRPVVDTGVIKVSGRIESDDAAVAVKTTGKILEIRVREGDRVKAGDVIAVLDDEQLAAREEQARAAVEQAETRITRATGQISVLEEQLGQSDQTVVQAKTDAQGRVKQAEGQVAQARSQVSQAEAQLAQAKVNLGQARYDEEKMTRLFKSGDVSERQAKQAQTNAAAQEKVVQAQQKQVETARANLNAARGTLTVARASLANPGIRISQSATIRKQIRQAESDIDAARAEAERARAQLREAQANRNDLEVIAPFAGIIATRTAEPGEVVTGGTAVVTLINPDAIYLRAFVPEGQIGRVRIGNKARIYLDSDPGRPIEAEVARIDPEATFTPENTYFQDERVKQVVGVKLSIKNPEGFAKPGMPADGEILTAGE